MRPQKQQLKQQQREGEEGEDESGIALIAAVDNEELLSAALSVYIT